MQRYSDLEVGHETDVILAIEGMPSKECLVVLLVNLQRKRSDRIRHFGLK
jgi:hypothetical protein